jgi:O-antigen ligase
MAGADLLMRNIIRSRKLPFLPFILLFATAFFLETSMHRVVFYLLSPFFISIIVKYAEERRSLFASRSFFLLLAYLAFYTVSAFWGNAYDPYDIFRNFVDAATIFIFCTSLAIALTRVEVIERHVFVISAFCLGAALIYGLIFYAGADFDFSQRLSGQGRFENSIHLSAMLALAILFLLSIRTKEGCKSSALIVALILPMLLLALMTQTRSSLVALVGCLVLAAMVHSRKTAFLIFAGAAISTIVCYFIWGQTFEDLYARGDTYRLTIWREALAMLKDHMVIGYGISTEPGFAFSADGKGYKSTHNVLVGHLYFGGIVGFGIFATLACNAVFQTVAAFLKNRRVEGHDGILARYTFLGVAFCIIISLFNFSHYLVGLHIQWLVFWLPFALTWYWEVRNRGV